VFNVEQTSGGMENVDDGVGFTTTVFEIATGEQPLLVYCKVMVLVPALAQETAWGPLELAGIAGKQSLQFQEKTSPLTKAGAVSCKVVTCPSQITLLVIEKSGWGGL
jgi:hypothetical protein